MLDQLIGKTVIVDMRSPYLCLGKLEKYDDRYLVLSDADLHDVRDSDTTRENYTAASRATGIKRNRKRVLIVRDEIIAISAFEDIVDE